jgi:hypothetical protein
VVRGLERVTDGGLLLRGEARRSYWLAIECLERTEQGDQVLGWRDRWKDLEDGRRGLEAAREAYVRGVVR